MLLVQEVTLSRWDPSHDFGLWALTITKTETPSAPSDCGKSDHDEQRPEPRGSNVAGPLASRLRTGLSGATTSTSEEGNGFTCSYRLYCLRWRCAVGMRSTARGQWVIGVVCSTPTTFEHPGSIMQGRGGCLLGGRCRQLTSVDRACTAQGSVRNVPDPTISPSASRV